MPRCDVCQENKRGSESNEIHATGQIICDECLRVGEEELDFDNPQNIDEETMEKALKTTKRQRQNGE